ncbi:MAG: prolipoprotein diacylglyceryl transferase [Oscillospiraceae bacterium]|nr:prolipoprotein diacylglyceryl transferase [Oscillospiraceae bacterium]
MYNVQFPKLGMELAVDRVAFTVFGVDVYWYGVLIAIGAMLGIAVSFNLVKRRGIDQDKYIDVLMFGTVGAIVCARAYYVAFAPFKYDSFIDMINIRDGGLAIYGGVIGAIVTAIIVCRWKKLPAMEVCDAVCTCFPLGQAIGRWGNFVNQEAFGTNTDGVFGMISEGTTAYLSRVQSSLAAQGIIVDPNAPVHPTFLYESVWCFVGFVLLLLWFNRKKFAGEMVCLYCAWYGLGRFIIEGLRTDSLEIFAGLRASQLVAAVTVIAGVVIIIYNRFDFKGRAMTEGEIDTLYSNRQRKNKR